MVNVDEYLHRSGYFEFDMIDLNEITKKNVMTKATKQDSSL